MLQIRVQVLIVQIQLSTSTNASHTNTSTSTNGSDNSTSTNILNKSTDTSTNASDMSKSTSLLTCYNTCISMQTTTKPVQHGIFNISTKFQHGINKPIYSVLQCSKQLKITTATFVISSEIVLHNRQEIKQIACNLIQYDHYDSNLTQNSQ